MAYKNYQELNPSNARIFIDYTNKKKPVRFEYPKKKSAFRICFSTFFFVYFFLNIMTIIAIVIITQLYDILSTETFVSVSSSSIDIILSVLIIGGYFIFLPMVLSLIIITNPTLLQRMPEINKKISSIFSLGVSYYKKIDKLNKKTFEIPMFANVFLDYKATEDFSEYLQKVTIKELDFKVEKRGFFRRKPKIINIDDVWHAIFYFSKVPKKGQLEVWFD